MQHDNKTSTIPDEIDYKILTIKDYEKVYNASKFRVKTDLNDNIPPYRDEKRLITKISKVLIRKKNDIAKHGLRETLEKHDIAKKNLNIFQNADDLLHVDKETDELSLRLNASNVKHMIAILQIEVDKFNIEKLDVLNQPDDYLLLDKLAVIAMISSMASSIIPYARHHIKAEKEDLKHSESVTQEIVMSYSHFHSLFTDLMEKTIALTQTVLQIFSKEIISSASSLHKNIVLGDARALFNCMSSLLKAAYIGRFATMIPISGRVYKCKVLEDFQFTFNSYSLFMQHKAFESMYWIYHSLDVARGDKNYNLSDTLKRQVIELNLKYNQSVKDGTKREWSDPRNSEIFSSFDILTAKECLNSSSPSSLPCDFKTLTPSHWDRLNVINRIVDQTIIRSENTQPTSKKIRIIKQQLFQFRRFNKMSYLCFGQERLELKCKLQLEELRIQRKKELNEMRLKYKKLSAARREQQLVAKNNSEEKEKKDIEKKIAAKIKAKDDEKYKEDVKKYKAELKKSDNETKKEQAETKQRIATITDKNTYLEKIESKQDAKRNFEVLQNRVKLVQSISSNDEQWRIRLINFWRCRNGHQQVLEITLFCMKFQIDALKNELPSIDKSHTLSRKTATKIVYDKVLNDIDAIEGTLFSYLEPIKTIIISHKHKTNAQWRLCGSICGQYFALLAETQVVSVHVYLSSYKTAPEFKMAIKSINTAIKRLNDAIQYLDVTNDAETLKNLKTTLNIYDDILDDLKSMQEKRKVAIEKAQFKLLKIQYYMMLRREKGFEKPFDQLNAAEKAKIRKNRLGRERLSNFIESSCAELVSEDELEYTSEHLGRTYKNHSQKCQQTTNPSSVVYDAKIINDEKILPTQNSTSNPDAKRPSSTKKVVRFSMVADRKTYRQDPLVHIPENREIKVDNSIIPANWSKERVALIEKHISFASNLPENKNIELLFQHTIKPFILSKLQYMIPWMQSVLNNDVQFLYLGSAVRRLVLSEKLNTTLEWDRDHDHLILIPTLNSLESDKQRIFFNALNEILPECYREKFRFNKHYGGTWHKVKDLPELKSSSCAAKQVQAIRRDLSSKAIQNKSILAPSFNLVLRHDHILLTSTVPELTQTALQNRQLMLTSHFKPNEFTDVAYLVKTCIFFFKDGYTFSVDIHDILYSLIYDTSPSISLKDIWGYCRTHYDININDIVSPTESSWADDIVPKSEELLLTQLRDEIKKTTTLSQCETQETRPIQPKRLTA